MDMDKPKLKPGQSLMMALNFDEDDLEANQQGIMSENQLAQLKDKRKSKLALGLILPLGIIQQFVGCFPITLSFEGILYTWPISLALPILVGCYFMAQCLRLHNDLRDGAVKIVEDRVYLDIGIKGLRYFVQVDGQKLNVTKNVFLAFKNGDPYCIFYTPNSKQILSAEWLRGE